MKYLTMVMRSGNPKATADQMNYTLISDTFEFATMPGTKLAEAISSGKATVTNMAVSAKGLVSTNGALKNYTTLDETGKLVGPARCVILNRIEVNGKLAGYMVFNTNGVVAKVTVAEAAALASHELLANGKIRHTSEGDTVASIGGNYPLLEVDIKESKDGKVTLDIMFLGNAIGGGTKEVEYAGFTVTSKSAKTIASLYSYLKKNNSALVETLKKKGVTNELLEGFKIRQAAGAGFYGVYPIKALMELKERGGEVKYSIKTPMISCMDTDSDCTESIVVYDPKKKAIVKSMEGNKKSADKLKSFYEVVTSKVL